MRWMLLACLIVAGCVDQDDPGAGGEHLLVHVTCTADFDSMMVTLDQEVPSPYDVGDLTQRFDYNYWSALEGIGPRTVSITVLAGGDAVATGQATDIVYAMHSDGSGLAEITLPLTP